MRDAASVQTWLPKKLNRHKVGVLAFDVPQSTSCAEGLQKSFKKYPTAKIVFLDKSLTFGNAGLQRPGRADEGQGRRTW